MSRPLRHLAIRCCGLCLALPLLACFGEGRQSDCSQLQPGVVWQSSFTLNRDNVDSTCPVLAPSAAEVDAGVSGEGGTFTDVHDVCHADEPCRCDAQLSVTYPANGVAAVCSIILATNTTGTGACGLVALDGGDAGTLSDCGYAVTVRQGSN